MIAGFAAPVSPRRGQEPLKVLTREDPKLAASTSATAHLRASNQRVDPSRNQDRLGLDILPLDACGFTWKAPYANDSGEDPYALWAGAPRDAIHWLRGHENPGRHTLTRSLGSVVGQCDILAERGAVPHGVCRIT